MLAALTIFAIFKWRNYPERVAASCLAYASCHFLYTVVYLLSGKPGSEWVLWNAGEEAARLSGSLVLLASFLASVRYLKFDRKRIKTAQLFGAGGLFLSVGYVLNAKVTNGLWVQDVLSSFAALACCFSFISMLSTVRKDSLQATLAATIPWLVLFIGMADLLGLYEIVSLQAWATYQNYQGLIVYRASSLFFNPNWYGAWLILAAVLLTYSYEEKAAPRSLVLLGMVFVGAGLFLSGSRAALSIAVVASLILVALKDAAGRRQILTCGFFCALGFGLVFLPTLMSHQITAVDRSLYPLAARWTSFHMEMASLAQPFVTGSTVSDISPEFAISFHGRFLGAIRDNGFLATFDNGGPFSVIGLAFFWIMWAVVLGRNIRRKTPTHVVYACAIFVAFTLWTVVARTLQVFPMWFFGSIIVAATLAATNASHATDSKRLEGSQ